MFELPPGKPLPLPKALAEASGPVTYEKYSVKTPVQCADCIQLSYERAMEGQSAPPIRMARFTRRQGRLVLRLCEEHREDRALRESKQGGSNAES